MKTGKFSPREREISTKIDSNAPEYLPRRYGKTSDQKGDQNPDLPFLAFLEKARKTTRKSKDFSLCRTPKIPGKEGKNAQKSKEIPCNEKSKEIQKSKERKIREVIEPPFAAPCMIRRRSLWCLAHRNRSDFCDLRLRCPSRTPGIAAISERTLIFLSLLFWISLLFSLQGISLLF